MTGPLETIDWRLERADEHLAVLNRERGIFRNQKNRRIVGEFHSDTSEYVMYFRGKLPDPSIGLRVGEFAHQLRSALDNLVWKLVRLRGGVPTHITEFPIYESRERYRRRRGYRALRGVSADDRAAIEAVQPFQQGEGAAQSYLALLAWLNNVDKHRFLHVGCALAETLPIPVYFGSTEGPSAGLFPWYPVLGEDVAEVLDHDYVSAVASDDPTELVRFRIRASGPNPKMEMESQAAVEIALSDPQHALTLADLRSIGAYVGFIIDGFRPRFNI